MYILLGKPDKAICGFKIAIRITKKQMYIIRHDLFYSIFFSFMRYVHKIFHLDIYQCKKNHFEQMKMLVMLTAKTIPLNLT